MTFARLVFRSTLYHWRTNAAVVLGVAAAVSVLSGALLVGDSVRGSLRQLALGRLGRANAVLTSPAFFREGLAADIAQTGGAAAPLITVTGIVTHEPSGRRASNVLVYGVDTRFWTFHGLDIPEGVHVSEALARELGARPDDVLLARVQRPSQIPLESLFGRRDEIGRTVRLTLSAALGRERLGEFAIHPQQGETRALFVPLRRVQRDLGVTGKVNAVVMDGGATRDTVFAQLRLADLGVDVKPIPDLGVVSVESASGILSDAQQDGAREALQRAGLTPMPVFTYLANSMRAGE